MGPLGCFNELFIVHGTNGKDQKIVNEGPGRNGERPHEEHPRPHDEGGKHHG